MTDVSSRRALNRATLARQLLLERAHTSVADAAQSRPRRSSAEDFVRRYLAAYGPARPADLREFSWLRTAEVFERLAPGTARVHHRGRPGALRPRRRPAPRP